VTVLLVNIVSVVYLYYVMFSYKYSICLSAEHYKYWCRYLVIVSLCSKRDLD